MESTSRDAVLICSMKSCGENLEGVMAKRKTGTYATVSGWLKIKNPNYTQSEQSERRHELFDSFKAQQAKRELPPIPKKPPVRSRPVAKKSSLAKQRQR